MPGVLSSLWMLFLGRGARWQKGLRTRRPGSAYILPRILHGTPAGPTHLSFLWLRRFQGSPELSQASSEPLPREVHTYAGAGNFPASGGASCEAVHMSALAKAAAFTHLPWPPLARTRRAAEG